VTARWSPTPAAGVGALARTRAYPPRVWRCRPSRHCGVRCRGILWRKAQFFSLNLGGKSVHARSKNLAGVGLQRVQERRRNPYRRWSVWRGPASRKSSMARRFIFAAPLVARPCHRGQPARLWRRLVARTAGIKTISNKWELVNPLRRLRFRLRSDRLGCSAEVVQFRGQGFFPCCSAARAGAPAKTKRTRTRYSSRKHFHRVLLYFRASILLCNTADPQSQSPRWSGSIDQHWFARGECLPLSTLSPCRGRRKAPRVSIAGLVRTAHSPSPDCSGHEEGRLARGLYTLNSQRR